MLKDTPQLPIKLIKDTGYQEQPEGSYSFALNAVNNADDGQRGTLVNEKGNFDYLDLPGDYCGHIIVNRYTIVVFTDDGSISIVNTKFNTIDTIITLPEFTFNKAYPITGEHRVVRGCENVIYWRDGINPDRYFNYSKPEDFKINGVFDVNQFSFIKSYNHPIINTSVKNSGGNTDYGSYFFAVEYVDNRGNTLFTSPLSIKYTVVEGGYNIDNYTPEVGGKPKSDSSIEITIDNISTDYEFIRINAVIYRSGNGVSVFAHAVGNLISINDDKITYVYTGYNPDAGDYQIDANSLLIDKSIYTSSMVMEQVDNRLIRGNLVESYKDYSRYQAYASKICTKYVVEQCSVGEKTELGGEVKAYGIVYVFKDGTTSPVFHIPGRKADEEIVIGYNELIIRNDSDSKCNEEIRYDITYTLDGVEYVDSGFFIGSKSIVTHTGDIKVISLNYYADCFNLIVNYDIQMNSINYMPSWKKYSTAKRESIYPEIEGSMGYYYSTEKYENPKNYCDDDYWGVDCNGEPLNGEYIRYHYLPDRTLEPLVLKISSNDQLYFPSTGFDINTLDFLNNNDLYNRIGVKFSNIDYPDDSIVGHYFVSNVRTPFNSIVSDKGLFFKWEGDDNNKKSRIVDYENTTNRNLYGFLSPEALFNSKYIDGDYIINEHTVNYSSDVGSSKEDGDFFKNSDLPFQKLTLYLKKHSITSYYQGSGLYSSVDKVYAISPKTIIKDENLNIENHSFSSKFLVLKTKDVNLNSGGKIFFGALKRNIEPFPNINSIVYRRITELNENRSFNGDGFISKFDVTNISWFDTDNVFTIPLLQQNKDSIKYEFEYIRDIVVESPVNTQYRHTGTTDCNTYYRGNGYNYDLYDYIIPKLVDVINGEKYPKEKPCEEWYGYNKDYSVNNVLNRYTDLPLLWDFCDPCTNKYPNRIIFSQKSLSEQLEDNYLFNLSNDYVDIPGDNGEITGIDYKDGKLLVRTEYSCYFLQPNPQQLNTNESTVYIGTGEFLSIPSLELNAEETGYGGQQHILESINTEHGFIWIDRQKGKVFKFANGLEEISRFGLQYWFMNNLPGDEYCILAYDPQYERLIISKKGQWTVSYDFVNKAWISYHSYLPDFFMNDGFTFYSIVANKLWRHKGATLFNNFFNTQYPYVVEFVVKDFMNFDTYSIQYYAVPFKNVDGEWIKSPDTVFDQMWVYNDFQSTGKVTLELDRGYDNIYFYPDKKHVKVTDDTYKINNIKAVNTNYSISTGEDPNKEPLPIDVQSQYDLVPVSGKFAVVRLYMNNGDTKMITHLLNTIKQYNIR